MRRLYLVCYDITDDKRRTKVFKAMNGFGDRMQYSVFRCDLSARERVELEATVTPLIDHDEDQILIVDLGPTDGRAEGCFIAIGRPDSDPTRHAVVV